MDSYRLIKFKRKVYRNLSRLERLTDKDKDKLSKTKAIHSLIHNLIEGYTKHPRCGLIWDMELALESFTF